LGRIEHCVTSEIESRSCSGEDRLDVTFYEACGASERVQDYGLRPSVATADRVTN
jgi:hypothetical protein